MTARELQGKDVQYTRAKGFDTFCPVGPCLATGLDYDNLQVVGRVNGEVRQQSSTAQLIFAAGYLVWAVSRVMTLHAGDIISTGTPSGIGPLRPGDVVEVEVEGIGVLSNPVGKRDTRGGTMKIFLDTASLKEIREGAAWGVVDGVTTNPSLLAKEAGDPEEILLEICKTVDGPISAEVVATDLEGMLREGRHWAGVHKNITVKVPCTLDGLKATKALSGEGHKVNVTLIFSADPGPARGQGGGHLRLAVRRPPRRHRRPRHGAGGRHRPDLRQLRLRLRGAGGEPAPSHPRGGGGARSGPTWAPCPWPSSPAS